MTSIPQEVHGVSGEWSQEFSETVWPRFRVLVFTAIVCVGRHTVCRLLRISERYACRLVCLARSTHWYESTKDEQAALWMRLKELAAVRVRYGYRRLHVLLRREGWQVNAKRVDRLYYEEKLSLRTKTPRRRVSWPAVKRKRTGELRPGD